MQKKLYYLDERYNAEIVVHLSVGEPCNMQIPRSIDSNMLPLLQATMLDSDDNYWINGIPMDKWEQYGVLARRVVLTDETLGIDNGDELDGMNFLPTGLRDISNEVLELVLQSIDLQPLPDWVDSFRNLLSLQITGGLDHFFIGESCEDFTHLPHNLPRTLKILHLTNLTRLTTLPDSIGSLSNLTELTIDECPIEEIPDSFERLTNLTELKLEHLQISEIPDSICNFTALTTLHLIALGISSIPDINSLSNLRDLYIESCLELETLPNIWELTSLLKLGLIDLDSMEDYDPQMEPSLYKLSSLTTLHVDKLEYVTLTHDEIGGLKNLEDLKIVTLNGLDFPVSFRKFRHLKNLNICSLPEWENPQFMFFKTFAESIPYLTKLETFDTGIQDMNFICPIDSLLCIAEALSMDPPRNLMGIEAISNTRFPLQLCRTQLGLPVELLNNTLVLQYFQSEAIDRAFYYFACCVISNKRRSDGTGPENIQHEPSQLLSGLPEQDIAREITKMVACRQPFYRSKTR